MQIGDKYIWKPLDYSKGTHDKEHRFYGYTVTVIGFDILDKVRVSVDDFPKTNYRENKNRFLADKMELFEVET